MSTPSQNPPRRLAYRSHHRRKSHAEAHATSNASSLPPILAHESVPQGQPAVVDQQPALLKLIGELRAAGSFGYDSEFIGEHTYRPWVCLIQVATKTQVTLIDPLAEGIDLLPFWELLADPAVEKIVHAGQQDLEPVMRHTGRPPANIFDIQIAVAFLGMPYPAALGKVVLALTQADLGPGLKFSQWDARPLSAVQLSYAANDVRYLPLAREIIAQKLAEKNLAAQAAEECRALSDERLYRSEPGSQRLRVRGVESLRPRQAAILRALLAWRETQAELDNIPPRMLLRDEVVLTLARYPAKSVQDLDRIKGLPRPVEDQHGETIVRLSREAFEAPPPAIPRPKHFDPEHYRGQIDSLLATLQQRCADHGIEVTMVTSKREVTQFIRALATGDASITTRLNRGWRQAFLGDLLPTQAVHSPRPPRPAAEPQPPEDATLPAAGEEA